MASYDAAAAVHHGAKASAYARTGRFDKARAHERRAAFHAGIEVFYDTAAARRVASAATGRGRHAFGAGPDGRPSWCKVTVGETPFGLYDVDRPHDDHVRLQMDTYGPGVSRESLAASYLVKLPLLYNGGERGGGPSQMFGYYAPGSADALGGVFFETTKQNVSRDVCRMVADAVRATNALCLRKTGRGVTQAMALTRLILNANSRDERGELLFREGFTPPYFRWVGIDDRLGAYIGVPAFVSTSSRARYYRVGSRKGADVVGVVPSAEQLAAMHESREMTLGNNAPCRVDNVHFLWPHKHSTDQPYGVQYFVESEPKTGMIEALFVVPGTVPPFAPPSAQEVVGAAERANTIVTSAGLDASRLFAVRLHVWSTLLRHPYVSTKRNTLEVASVVGHDDFPLGGITRVMWLNPEDRGEKLLLSCRRRDGDTDHTDGDVEIKSAGQGVVEALKSALYVTAAK